MKPHQPWWTKDKWRRQGDSTNHQDHVQNITNNLDCKLITKEKLREARAINIFQLSRPAWYHPSHASAYPGIHLGMVPNSNSFLHLYWIHAEGSDCGIHFKAWQDKSQTSRIIDLLCQQLVSNSQHADQKFKSTEKAFLGVVSTIEDSLYMKGISLVSFLDIEEAFNNVMIEAIMLWVPIQPSSWPKHSKIEFRICYLYPDA